MCAGEHGDVHGDAQREGLVQAHAEVPLPTQQEQDEHTNMEESHTGCRHRGLVIYIHTPTHIRGHYSYIHTHPHTSEDITVIYTHPPTHTPSPYSHWSARESFR